LILLTCKRKIGGLYHLCRDDKVIGRLITRRSWPKKQRWALFINGIYHTRGKGHNTWGGASGSSHRTMADALLVAGAVVQLLETKS
jgi:hypothetical protein